MGNDYGKISISLILVAFVLVLQFESQYPENRKKYRFESFYTNRVQ